VNSPDAWQSNRRRSNVERCGSPKTPDVRPGPVVGGSVVGAKVGAGEVVGEPDGFFVGCTVGCLVVVGCAEGDGVG